MFPKSIQNNLPSDYNLYYTCIYSAYTELLRGHKLGLFTYIANNEKVELSNYKNYPARLTTLINNFERYKLLLPEETELNNIPDTPTSIKYKLEKCLSYKTNDDNIKLIINAIFKGTDNNINLNLNTNLSKKTEHEKFEIYLIKNIKIKHRSTKK